MPLMRSVFYVPGNREDFIAKIADVSPDIVTFDLEDSVPPAEKENARKISHKNLKFAAGTGALVYARLNNWETGMTNADCEAIVDVGLDGVCLAKCGGPNDVKRLDWKLEEMEQRRGLKKGSIAIQLLMETAKGVMNCYDAALASPRVNSLIFGAVDYTTDMRIPLIQPNGDGTFWARSRVCCAARAAGLIAIDAPYVGFKDTEGFIKDTEFGRNLGFEGRMLIHPSQIEPSHKVYSPSAARVEWAKAVVDVFEKEGIAKGSAAVTLNGKMVDTPVYIGAKQILEAQAAIDNKPKKK
jgi:citrate lyase subunit beta/citryl-CoA lyase